MVNKFQQIKAAIKLEFSEVTDSIEKKRLKDKLVDDHFWDMEHDGFTPSHHIDFSKKLLQHLSIRDRAIFVLIKSGEFTYKEIQGLSIRLESRQIKRVFKSIKSSQ